MTHIVIVQMPEISPGEWMRTMLVSILITSGIPRQTRTDISQVLQSVNQWLYPKIWALIIQEKNASYIRVRNITLGYNLGPKELSVFKGYIRGIRVFVDFQNPLTFTKYKGYDPEINTSSSNLTGGQYPQMRVYSIGAKLTF
mgnify:CR=1 FL=1